MKIIKKGVTMARLQTILGRQHTPAFAADYQAAIRAVREEAPSMSSAFTLRSPDLGRELHLLSPNELAAALIALYIPGIRDIHDQKMLHTGPGPHPLYGFPGVVNVGLPGVSGTVKVAERLGYLDLHPLVSGVLPSDPSRKITVPYPSFFSAMRYCGSQRKIGLRRNPKIQRTHLNNSANRHGKRLINFAEKPTSVLRLFLHQ